MADNRQFPAGNERQERVEELVDQGHSRAHAVGVTWAEQAPGYVPPAEHGVDEPSFRLDSKGRP